MSIAIVTGASSGMGQQFVLQLSNKYPKLEEIWVIARRKERMEELQKAVHTKLRIFAIDLTDKEMLEIFKQELSANKPRIVMLVNASGYGVHGKIEERPMDETLGMIDLNCYALTQVTYLCLPYMSKNARIINLASAAAFVPQPKFTVYAASKSYVLSFSRALNAELKNRNIHVTAVCPGPVNTEFFRKDNCNIEKTFYKRLVMADADKVVAQAILDSVHKKEVSVYGIIMKTFYFMTKVVPHRLLLKIMQVIL